MGWFSPGRKPRQFEYKPRHYDPEAEEREARRRMILGEDYAEGEYRPGMYIREKRLMRMQQADRDRRVRNKRTMVRSVIFLGMAVVIVYFMFTYFGKSFS